MQCQSSDDESFHASHSPSKSSGSASDMGLPREGCMVSTEDLYEAGTLALVTQTSCLVAP